MSKRMLISVDRDESRAAVIEDGQLVHLEIEPVARNTCKGNIYRAQVARVEPSLQSAFVDFGNEKQGFMPVGEIHPKLRAKNDDKKAPIQELIKARQEVLVQVVRDEIGQKGATLSTFISLPGRYLVLIPESDKEKAGVSRKLSDEARDRIKKLTETMKVPEGFGLIVRTAGETATETELAKDLLYLTRQWESITKKYDESKGPTLLYAERSLAVRFVRDYFTKDIDELVIDDDETLHEVQEFLSVLMPRSLAHVQRYAGDMPLFARYGIEGKVEDVFARQVYLPSGGSIVIDQTEALVSIDVNSGRVKEKDIEETARATNIEAAEEIARQLMLRDMGGLVVIDFIDMREKKYVREVEQALKDAFKNDKARTKLGHISEFGLLEMSRQRIKSSVNKGTFDACVHCSGTGRMRSFESVAMSVLRRIYELVSQKRVKYIIATVPAASARYLLNARRAELAGVEKQYHLTIEVIPVQDMSSTQVIIEHLEEVPLENGAERADRQKLLRVTQEMDLVRNHLIHREETKMAIEAAVAKRGAKVDYAEIYKEVRAMAPIEHEAPPRNARRPAAGDATGHDSFASQIVDVEIEDVPPPRGFVPWIKSLFGMGAAPAHYVADTVAAPAPALAAPKPAMAAPGAEAAPGEAQADGRERGGRPDRERRERRERRDGREPREPREPREGRTEARTGDRPERAERPERGERLDRGERTERGERPERGERAERGERTERTAEASEKTEIKADAARPEALRAEVRPAIEASEAAPAKTEGAAAGEEAAGDAAGSDGRRRRRRRRRGGGGDRGESNLANEGAEGEDDDAQGAEAQDSGDGRESAVAVPASTAANAAEVHVVAAESAQQSTVADTAAADVALLAAEAEVEVAAADDAVDARSMMQAEIAKILGEQTLVAPVESADTAPAATVVSELPKPSATKRFVIDLRTPK